MGEFNKKTKDINRPRVGSKVKFFSHPDYVVDFMGVLCRKMSTKKAEELGLEGLAIVGPRSEEDTHNGTTNRHAQRTRRWESGYWGHEGKDDPQDC